MHADESSNGSNQRRPFVDPLEDPGACIRQPHHEEWKRHEDGVGSLEQSQLLLPKGDSSTLMLLVDTAHPWIRIVAVTDITMPKTHAMTRYPASASFCPITTSLGLL